MHGARHGAPDRAAPGQIPLGDLPVLILEPEPAPVDAGDGPHVVVEGVVPWLVAAAGVAKEPRRALGSEGDLGPAEGAKCNHKYTYLS